MLLSPSSSCFSASTRGSKAIAQVEVLPSVQAVLFLLLLLAALFVPHTAHGTLVIPVSETNLAQQAEAIVVGRVTNITSYLDPRTNQIFTRIALSVQEILKGDIFDPEITITQVGGTIADLQSWIEGSPEFTRGEKVLLFLSRNPDGTPRVLHLYQGKFSVFTDQETGKEFAYREAHPHGVRTLPSVNISGHNASSESTTLSRHGFYDFEALKTQIHSVVENAKSYSSGLTNAPLFTAPTPLPTGSVVQVQDAFTLLGSPAARWFEPDSALPVTVKINAQNSPTGGVTAVQSAMQAWSTVSGSSFSWLYGGSTSSGGIQYDGVNAASFGDPLNQIDSPSGCSGVLAIGGYYRSGSQTKVVNGKTFYKILEGDLVFANGWQGCGFYENPTNVAEVATHELGHVLGLGHSSDSTATMYAYAHFDGRGASLRSDDKAGLTFIYPGSTSSPPPPTCTFSLSPTSKSFSSSGGSSSVLVTASLSTCSWTAKSNVSWITITSGATRTGSKRVYYSVASNRNTSSRTGTMTIAGKTFTVTQSGRTTSTSMRFSD
jgi:hypothetical protein